MTSVGGKIQDKEMLANMITTKARQETQTHLDLHPYISPNASQQMREIQIQNYIINRAIAGGKGGDLGLFHNWPNSVCTRILF